MTTLEMLADVALDIPTYDSDDSQSLTSSPPSSPVARVHKLRPRKSEFHRVARLQLKTQPAARDSSVEQRRRLLSTRAAKIRTLGNSPVDARQLFVLQIVYNEMTAYPPESWQVLMAIVLRRSIAQVKNWFSNARQKQRGNESELPACVDVHNELGEKLRMRTTAVKCGEWTDAFFEETLLVLHHLSGPLSGISY